MRIIAGEFRSRVLRSPRGMATRPIPDRVKESVFAMLGERLGGARVVDAFAGSGSIGLEALSRGAASVLFIDRDRDAMDVLRANIELLGVDGRCAAVLGDALGLSVIARLPRPTDVVFLDPPYPLVQEPSGWDRVRGQCAAMAEHLAPDGFLILRTPSPHWLVEAAVSAGGADAPAGHSGATPGAARRGARNKKKAPRERWDWRAHDALQGSDATPHNAAGPGADAADLAQQAEAGLDDDSEAAQDPEGLEAEPPRADRREPEMAIAGLRGPETHVYGKTAVHWYMKAAP
ncbi:MAG: 16S rRNA (guanine(966)-N(2))-methyltransferase RsmD [Planctomyces sp.]|nr:16S rRNA (guanine(966)-N(2))-methyltransferase RsmD [Planctomyces sp.]